MKSRRSWVCLLLLTGLSACALTRSAGRSLGAGAVEAVTARDTALFALERGLADTAGAYLNQAFATAVLNPARATSDSIARRLAQQVETDLSRSFRRLLAENFDVIDRRGAGVARTTARTLTDELDPALPRLLARVGDTLAQRVVNGLALGLRDVVQPMLHEVMQEVTDSVRSRIREVDTTVVQTRTAGGLRYGLLVAIGGVLLIVAIIAYAYWRRQHRALNALIDAIHTRPDPALHEAIRSCARDAGVAAWLSERVERRQGPNGPDR